MKNINLKKNVYYEKEIICAEVDEKELEFINGIAVAKATLTEIDVFGKKTVFESYGLIDEDYNEIFDGSLSKNSSDEKTCSQLSEFLWSELSLMFSNLTKEILRCSENDFVTKIVVPLSDGDLREEIHHIRLIDGKPKHIRYLDEMAKKTEHENLLMIGRKGVNMQLYDIYQEKYLTPKLYSITPSSVNKDVFDAVARVDIDEPNELEYVEYLFFLIVSKGKRVSQVISSFVGGDGYINIYDEGSVEKMLETRKIELQNQADYFLKKINRLRENPRYLEEHHQTLNKTLIKKDK